MPKIKFSRLGNFPVLKGAGLMGIGILDENTMSR